jgi:arginyl-tRNA synthetase
VVDADDLMQQMFDTAGDITAELGKLEGYSQSEKQALYRVIGLGALKYYILKVDPRKRILFNPEESVDFQGNTGPFIQYTYARIQSILRKAADEPFLMEKVDEVVLQEKEKEVLKQLHLYPEVVQQAAKEHSPALIANFTYELVKAYNSFFQNVPIFRADSDSQRAFRVQLSGATGEVIRSAFNLLGIEVPERM